MRSLFPDIDSASDGGDKDWWLVPCFIAIMLGLVVAIAAAVWYVDALKPSPKQVAKVLANAGDTIMGKNLTAPLNVTPETVTTSLASSGVSSGASSADSVTSVAQEDEKQKKIEDLQRQIEELKRAQAPPAAASKIEL